MKFKSIILSTILTISISFFMNGTTHVNAGGINSTLKQTPPSLLEAIQDGRIDEINNLIVEGADANLSDSTGMTPLMIAVQTDHIDIVAQLIHNGANVNLTDNQGRSALIWAIKSRAGAFDIKKLHRNPAPETPTPRDIIVENLVHHHANVNHSDDQGMTALIYAAIYGSIDITNTLIQHGAELDHKDHQGFTALAWAAINKHTDTVEKLINRGAHVQDTLTWLTNNKWNDAVNLLKKYETKQ